MIPESRRRCGHDHASEQILGAKSQFNLKRFSLKSWLAPDLVGSAAARQGGRTTVSRARKGSTIRLWASHGTWAGPAKARIRARKSGPCRGANAAGTASDGEHGRYCLR